jgi:hypothetical protein
MLGSGVNAGLHSGERGHGRRLFRLEARSVCSGVPCRVPMVQTGGERCDRDADGDQE